mmetsp:Transcript_37790/g.99944  ORF Transcript_37790/g.99944 Transcript_37790/m.99944 type:complete len:147 (-) Transcript_37790:282-722(-)
MADSDANFREAFQIFDQDQDGVVSAAELQRVMKAMGNTLTDQEVRDIMKEAGSTTSISYPAFSRLMGVGLKNQRDTDPEDEIRDAFKLFDLDGDGQISPKDMVKALAQFGVTLTDSDVDKLIGEATLSRDRNVSYEIFKRVMTAAR